MTDVGSARVQVVGDVRDFARQAEQDLNRGLSKIKLDPVNVPVDDDAIAQSGLEAGGALGDGITRGADGRLRDSRGKFVKMGDGAGRAIGEGVSRGAKDSLGKSDFSSFLKKAFTPNPGMFQALRAPFAAALSTPIVGAVVTVAGIAALAFIGAFAAAIATAGLGAVFLGIGAAALFGAKKSRDDAEKDLDKAEERVRKAELAAQSGTAASKRSLADARVELAKTQDAVSNNQAFVKLDSSLSRLGATLKRVGQDAAKPLLGPFTKALDTLGKGVERIGPLLTNIFAGLAPAIGPLTQGMIGFVEEFLKVLNEDPATIEAMRDALIALGANLPRIGAALGRMFALFASNENNVRNIGLLFGLIEQEIGHLATSIFLLSKALDGIIIGWNAVKTAGSAAVDWITGAAIPAIIAAASAVVAFFRGIPGAVSSVWASITGFFSSVGASITGFVSSLIASIVGFFTALPGRVIAAMAALPGLIGAFFSNTISNVAFMIGFGLGTIVSFFINLPGRIVSAIAALPGLVAGVLNAVRSAAVSIVSSSVSAVVGFFAQLPGRVRSAISALVSVVSSVLSSAGGAARSQASSLVSGAVGIIQSLPGKIRSALSTVKSAVTGAFAGASSWLVSAGRSLITGIISGIASAIGGAVSAAQNAAKQIVAGFKSALKIGSPSKVMEDEVGRWIPAGAAVGIEKNMKSFDDQIRAMLGPDLTGVRGGDSASVASPGGSVTVTIAPGAIVIQGQGKEAGEEAAGAILQNLAAATLVR